MSHNISTQNSISEVFVAGKPAWHRLGTQVNNTVKWEQAMKYAHLNWTVSKHQLQLKGKDVPSWGIVRDDNNKYLSTVGPEFTPIQNKECFSFVDNLLDIDNNAYYESAGALNDGQTIWCMAKLSKDINIGDDKLINYLLFVDYRVQGKSAIVKLCNTRVVCNNTLNVALKEKQDTLRLRHSRNISERMREAKYLIQNADLEIKSLSEKLKFLAKKKVNKRDVGKVLKYIFPNIEESKVQQNKAITIVENFENNDGDVFKEQRGTAYNLLNAVTNYVDHSATVRVQDNGELVIEREQLREQKRAESALFGQGDQLKAKTLDFILDTVEFNSDKSRIGNILSSVSL